jgi:hypothetical protein
LVTTPSHFAPQKDKGKGDGFTGNGGIITSKKILMGIGSQGKNARQFGGLKMIENVPAS